MGRGVGVAHTMAWAAPKRATTAYEKRILAGGVGDCLQ